MGAEQHHSGRRPLSGSVRGVVRSALLGWTDPVSGERLRIRVEGQDDLVETLEPLGFERLDGGAERDVGTDEPRARPRRVKSWSLRAQVERRLGPAPDGSSMAAG